MINKEKKSDIISKFQRKDGDTGSSEVQIAILTTRIKEITDHLSNNKKDFHSRRGLIQLVAKRKKLLNYLAKTDLEKCRAISKELNIRDKY